MLRISSRIPHLLVLIGATLLWSAGCAPEDSRPERIVAYVNNDDARGLRLLQLLRAALETATSDDYRIRVVHVRADMSDSTAIRARLAPVVKSRPAAIIATNGESAAVAKSLTPDIPIIFGSQEDPIHLRLVNSLARPGGNVTGFTYYVAIDQKRLELLRELSPRIFRVGILVDRWWFDESGGRKVVDDAALQGMEAHLFRAETTAELAAALGKEDARHMDAWYVPVSMLPFDRTDEVVALLGTTGKPVIYPATLFVERGGLVSYQQLFPMEESSRLIANMVRLVLEGVPPGDIPVERPKSFELAINLHTARQLGLSVSRSYVKRADRVIE